MKITYKWRILLLVASLNIFMAVPSAQASSSAVFEHSVSKPMDQVYGEVYKALEDDGFYVVFEANIGRNLSNFADKWGDKYNQNNLQAIRSMVFCNAWYANAVSNVDPAMLALCPLNLTLIEAQGKTSVLFAKPTALGLNSPALKILQRIENDVIAAIRQALAVD